MATKQPAKKSAKKAASKQTLPEGNAADPQRTSGRIRRGR